MPDRPNLHVLLFAPPGSGKSHFAATFPKPLLVLAFDPVGKMTAYYERGEPSPEQEGAVGQGVVTVTSKRTYKLIEQVEFYHDDELTRDGGMVPVAYERFLARLPLLYDEVREGKWKTVVLDSLTPMKLASHNLHHYKLNKTDKDERRWDKLATDDLEQALCCRLTTLRCNVIIIAHVDKDKDEVAGIVVGQPAAPGRLSRSDGLAARYPELYTIRTKRDPSNKGRILRTLQTQPDASFNCMSVQIDAPDGILLNDDAGGGKVGYTSLWENYDAKHGS